MKTSISFIAIGLLLQAACTPNSSDDQSSENKDKDEATPTTAEAAAELPADQPAGQAPDQPSKPPTIPSFDPPDDPSQVVSYPEVMPVLTDPPKVLSGKVAAGELGGVEVFFEVPPTTIMLSLRGSALSHLPPEVIAKSAWAREPTFQGKSTRVEMNIPANAPPGKYLYEIEMRSGLFLARYTLKDKEHVAYQLTTCKTSTPDGDCGPDAKTEPAKVRVPYNEVLAAK